MNSQKAEIFIKTVELGSLTKAAEALGYTQSGISHIIQAIEEETGTTLLLRNRSGIVLTGDGQNLLPYIRRICDAGRSLSEEIDRIHGLESGCIRIGTFSSVSCHWLPVLIKDFKELHPGIDFELIQGDYAEIETWAKEGRIDFGFVRLPILSGLPVIPLKKDRLLVTLPTNHPHAKNKVFPISALCEETFILVEEGSNSEIENFFQQTKIHPNIRFRVKDDYTIMSMVENELGISLLPELVLYRNPYNIVCIELDHPHYRSLGIVKKDTSIPTCAVQSFLDFITNKIIDL